MKEIEIHCDVSLPSLQVLAAPDAYEYIKKILGVEGPVSIGERVKD